MTIIDEIKQKAVEYLKRTGADPTTVYLGRRQYDDLRLWALQECTFTDPGTMRCMSYRVKKVDQDDHLAVSGRIDVHCPDCGATGEIEYAPGPDYYCTACGSQKIPSIATGA